MNSTKTSRPFAASSSSPGRWLSGRARRLFPMLAMAALATVAAAGCMGNPDDAEQVGSSEQALARGGGSVGQSFSCTNGTCTCDKSIENDCWDMTAVCSDATVDGVVTCINGWLTTHCTCTQALVAPPKPTLPIKGVVTKAGVLTAR